MTSPPLTMADLVAQPSRVAELSPEQARGLLVAIASIQPLLIARALATSGSTGGTDRLLKIDEAATRLGQSPDWLYRRAPRLPFTVRQGRGLRFSERGLAAYIAQHANGRHGA
jgi:predicted DNA-binding transcriptional regulator AlpA